MRKLERRCERAAVKNGIYLDCKGYGEGDSEIHAREINYSDPVADAAERNALENAVRNIVSELQPLQQRRVWLYAQGYTYAEIAATEGVYVMAVHKSVKCAKKIIERSLGKWV